MALVKINRKLAALVKTWCFPANRRRWRVEFPIGYANNYVLAMMAVPSFGFCLPSLSFIPHALSAQLGNGTNFSNFRRVNFAVMCDTFSLNFGSDQVTLTVECNLDEWQRSMNFHRISDASRPRCPGHLGRAPFRTWTLRTSFSAKLKVAMNALWRATPIRGQLQSCRWIEIESDVKCRSPLPSLCFMQHPAKHLESTVKSKIIFQKDSTGIFDGNFTRKNSIRSDRFSFHWQI